jgi:two-component system sensor histidine kinase QseC
MKVSLRIRFFLWLLLLLVIFMLVQTVVYTGVEIATLAKHPDFSVREQLEEVVMGVGMNILLLPLLAVVAWWISSRMIKPIRTLASTAKRIGDGQLDHRVDAQAMPDDEMRTLAGVMNLAFDRYQRVMRDLDRFTGDASHQLRTPLASIRMTAEVALSRKEDSGSSRDVLGSILEDVAKLSHLVDQLLAMARLGADGVRTSFTEVDAGQLLRSAVDFYRPTCKLLGLTLDAEDGADCAVCGNQDLLMEALRNLIDNAMRFAGDKGRIRLTVVKNDSVVEISVMDTGPGIAEEHAEAIFERFYRVPSSSSAGSGLGLALVREILRIHGGSIRLASRPGWGAVFVISLPAC